VVPVFDSLRVVRADPKTGLDDIAKSYLDLVTFWYKDEASLDECVQAYCREALAVRLTGYVRGCAS